MIEVMSLDHDERIARLCAHLIVDGPISAVRFITRGGSDVRDRDPVFTFLLDQQKEISSRLAAVGFDLHVSQNRDYAAARPREEVGDLFFPLTAQESKFLIGLAYAYESRRADMGRYGTIDLSLSELIGILISDFSAFPREPPARDIKRVMTRFERCGFIVRRRGGWAEGVCEFTILPAIQEFTSRDMIAAFEAAYSAELERIAESVNTDAEADSVEASDVTGEHMDDGELDDMEDDDEY